MMKLLRADFSRLCRNRIFRIAGAAAVFLGILAPVWGHRVLVTMIAPHSNYSLDYYFFIYVNVTAVVVVMFCSFFMGVDYNDGTIRNKISMGHSRQAIYLSNLITNIVSACVLYTMYMVCALCVGLPYMGAFQHFTRGGITILILCAYASIIAFASVTTLVGMAFHNYAVSLGVSLCVIVAALCIGVYQLNLLTEAAFWAEGMAIEREITLFLVDFLPGSQMMVFFFLKDNPADLNPFVMLGGSAFFIAASTVIGLLVFHKKELK